MCNQISLTDVENTSFRYHRFYVCQSSGIVAKRVNLCHKESKPPDFQIRLGGVKDVSKVWFEAFPVHIVKDDKIFLSDSMGRFDCLHRVIDVVECS